MSGTEFWALISALAGNTISLWSGAIGLLVSIAGLAIRQDDKRGILLVVAGLVSLFISPAVAWLDEHRLAQTLVKENTALKEAVGQKEPELRIYLDEPGGGVELNGAIVPVALKDAGIMLPNVIIKNVGGGIAQNVSLRLYLSEQVFGQKDRDGDWYDTGSSFRTTPLMPGTATGVIYGGGVRLLNPAPSKIMAMAKVSYLLSKPASFVFTLVPRPP